MKTAFRGGYRSQAPNPSEIIAKKSSLAQFDNFTQPTIFSGLANGRLGRRRTLP